MLLASFTDIPLARSDAAMCAAWRSCLALKRDLPGISKLSRHPGSHFAPPNKIGCTVRQASSDKCHNDLLTYRWLLDPCRSTAALSRRQTTLDDAWRYPMDQERLASDHRFTNGEITIMPSPTAVRIRRNQFISSPPNADTNPATIMPSPTAVRIRRNQFISS